MKIFLLALFAILLLFHQPVAAEAQKPMPDYLQDLDRPFHAGDWTLQCNGSRFCQIIGVVKIPNNHKGLRAIVMINRGIEKGTLPSLRLAFVDGFGSPSRALPTEEWRLHARGLRKKLPPLQLSFGDPDADGGYRVTPDLAENMIDALRRWPGSVILSKRHHVARMPVGDLARLMRKMDRLQHPKRTRISAEDTALWLKEYHYVTLRPESVEATAPDNVLLSCDNRVRDVKPQSFRIGPDHLLWTAGCPEGVKIFLQHGDEEVVKFDVRDNEGIIRPHSHAAINGQSLLEIILPKKGNDGCGRRLQMGFTGQDFVMIEDRRYDRCRGVPQKFWPIVWHPTSWKQVDLTASSMSTPR